MKLTILRVLCVLLIAAVLGLYGYGVLIKGEAPTENLPRTVIILLSAVSVLIKLNPKRRTLREYAASYAKELGNAFAEDVKKREALLEAVRLFDEDKCTKAIKALAALKLDARTRDEHYAVGLFTALCQTDLGLNDAAIATYEAMIGKGAVSSQLYSNLGSRYGAVQQVEKAVSAYRKASELDDQNPLPYSNLANLLVQTGDYEGAEKAALAALALNPQQYQAASAAAMACSALGRVEEMQRYANMAIAAGQDAQRLSAACHHYAAVAASREAMQA